MVAGEEAALALLAGAVSAVVLGGCSAASGAECGPEVHFLTYSGTRLRQDGSS